MLLEPKPDYSFDANATYLIAGGLGGLGRCIARWMVRRGTSNLLLLSRSGPGPKAQALLDELRLKGARVETPICDVTDTSSIVRMLDDYRKILPPIKGCIQCSMVLKVSFDRFDFYCLSDAKPDRMLRLRPCPSMIGRLVLDQKSRGLGISTLFCQRRWTFSSFFPRLAV